MKLLTGLAFVLGLFAAPTPCLAVPQGPTCRPLGGGWEATPLAGDPRYASAVPIGEAVRIPVEFMAIEGYAAPDAAKETIAVEVISEGLVTAGEVRGFHAIGRGIFEALWASDAGLIEGQAYVARVTADNSKLFGCDTTTVAIEFAFTVTAATLEELASDVGFELGAAVETVVPTSVACCSVENGGSFQCWDSIVEPRTTAQWRGSGLPYLDLTLAPTTETLIPRASTPFAQDFAISGEGEFCVEGSAAGRIIETCGATPPTKTAPELENRIRVHASSCDEALDDVTTTTWLNVVRAATEADARAVLAGMATDTPPEDIEPGATETAGSTVAPGPNPVDSSGACSFRQTAHSRRYAVGWALALAAAAAVFARRARSRSHDHRNGEM